MSKEIENLKAGLKSAIDSYFIALEKKYDGDFDQENLPLEAICWKPIETVDTSRKVSIFSKRGGVDDCAYFQDGNWINGFDRVIIKPLFWRERVLP